MPNAYALRRPSGPMRVIDADLLVTGREERPIEDVRVVIEEGRITTS